MNTYISTRSKFRSSKCYHLNYNWILLHNVVRSLSALLIIIRDDVVLAILLFVLWMVHIEIHFYWACNTCTCSTKFEKTNQLCESENIDVLSAFYFIPLLNWKTRFWVSSPNMKCCMPHYEIGNILNVSLLLKHILRVVWC